MRALLALVAGGPGRVSVSAAAIVACIFVLAGHGWDLLAAAWHASLFASGFFALEAAVGRAIAEHAPDPVARAGAEAERIALEWLQEVMLGVLPDHQWIDAKDGKERFRAPSVVGAVCRACGCSQEDPCDEGCGWHDAVTCTACVGSGEAAHG